MDMDYQEGYADGIAGAGMQDRLACDDQTGAMEYQRGFIAGSQERRIMLANEKPNDTEYPWWENLIKPLDELR